MGGWRQEAMITARGLFRRPRLALGVALTLGVGIGATTTIYSVVDGVLFRPLDYEEPGRLVALGATFPGREWEDESEQLQHLAGMSLANLDDFQERSHTLERLAAIERTSVLIPDQGDGPELVSAAEVGSEFFTILGVRPALGRTFLPEEESSAVQNVVLLSHAAWQQRFGADPGILGRTLDRFGGALTVVGVLPEGFQPPETFFNEAPQFWLPLRRDHPRYAERGRRTLVVIGRLRTGATVPAARAEARAVAAALAQEFPASNVYPDGSHLGIGVNTLLGQTVGRSASILRLFLGAAALLLALSSLNAATLLLARALERMRELDIRMALGSGRAQLMRLLVGEAGLLALLGGALGVASAYAGVAVFVRYAPPSIPRLHEIGVDGRVLAIALLTSVGAGLVAGVLPAARLTARLPFRAGVLHARGRPKGAARLRSLLVGSQMAVAMVLVSSASLLFASLVHLHSTDPGFDAEGLTTLRVPLKRPGAPELEPWQDWDRLLAELAGVPSITAVAGVTDPPFRTPSWAPRVLLPGDAEDTQREGIAGYAVTPGYFATLRTEVLEGRVFTDGDGPDAARVAVVNDAFVQTQLGGRVALGTPIRLVDGDQDVTAHIVGVVANIVQARTDEGALPALYVPHRQSEWTFMEALVRSDAAPEVVRTGLREAARRFNPVLPPNPIQTMDDRMAATRIAPRFHAVIIGGFAVVATLLAALGLYGALAHAVGERRQELGVRVALGASRATVVRLVFRGGLTIAAGGLLCGFVATLPAHRVLRAFLFGVRPADPLVLATTGGVLLLASLVACWLPARNATTVDPAEVLRES